MNKAKVVIIDDSKLVRTVFSGLLNDDADIEVVATSDDPYDALDKITQHKPDVVVLDVEMSKLDSIKFIDKLKSLDVRTIVSTNADQSNIQIAMHALECGASGYIIKPAGAELFTDLEEIGTQLAQRVRFAHRLQYDMHMVQAVPESIDDKTLFESNYKFDHQTVVGIAASTYNMQAIWHILMRLPSGCPPVIITMDVGEEVIDTLIQRLSKVTILGIQRLRERDKLASGRVYVRINSDPIQLGKDGSGKYIAIKGAAGVDSLFNSMLEHGKSHAIGILLDVYNATGDGLEGIAGIKKAGGYSIILEHKSLEAEKELGYYYSTALPCDVIALNALSHCQKG